jgi:predicted nucleic acid-binding protein
MPFAGRVLPFTEGASMRCANLHVPDRRSDRDSMTAVVVMEHGFAIVTRNVPVYEGTAVQLLNPWAR